MKRKAMVQKDRKTTKRVRRYAPEPIVIGRSSAAMIPEMKAVDTNSLNTITSGTAAVLHLTLMNCPLLGTERYNRIGRRIQIKKINVMISVQPVTPVPTSVPEDIIIVLFVDIDGGTQPSLPDLFTTVDNGGAAVGNVYSMRNLNTTSRFKVLKVKRIPLRICGTMTGALPCNGAAFQATQDDLQFSWNVKTDVRTQFNANSTGNSGDIENGAIYLGYWSSIGAGLPNSAINITTRCRYYD